MMDEDNKEFKLQSFEQRSKEIRSVAPDTLGSLGYI